jgi:hypothetical protein
MRIKSFQIGAVAPIQLVRVEDSPLSADSHKQTQSKDGFATCIVPPYQPDRPVGSRMVRGAIGRAPTIAPAGWRMGDQFWRCGGRRGFLKLVVRSPYPYDPYDPYGFGPLR